MTLNVFLDANVLVPIGLTDLLLRAGEDGLIDPHWSPEVLAEVTAAVATTRPNQPPEALQRRFAAMNAAFPYALTSPDAQAMALFDLPDSDDQHVAAAALACQAQTIVTHNIRDFPAAAVSGHGLTAVTPDSLLLSLFTREPERIVALVEAAAAATRCPPLTADHILAALSKAGVTGFAAAATTYLERRQPRSPVRQ